MKLILSFLLLLSLPAFSQKAVNGVVNLKDWGIAAHTGAVSGIYKPSEDIYPKLIEALSYMKANGIINLYIPADMGGIGSGYYCSRTIEIKQDIHIYGDGVIDKPYTLINFPARTKGFYIPQHNTNVNISNLKIFQDWVPVGNYGDTSAHGFHSKSMVHLNNFHVGFAAGVGIKLEGCLEPGAGFGNVDFSQLDNCMVQFADMGLYITGCDANKIVINKFNANAIRRWGVYDNGMLGNVYNSPHFAFCGTNVQSNVVVNYSGKTYIAVNNDDVINRGKRPDLFPQYWEESTEVAGEKWSDTARYFSGGPVKIANDNAWSIIYDPYYEAYQPPARLNSRSVSFNGTPGVATLGGNNKRMLFGIEYNSAKLASPGILLGNTTKDFPDAPLHAVHDPTKGEGAAAIFESANNELWLELRNKTGKGLINYNLDQIRFFPGGVKAVTFSPVATYLHNLKPSTSTKILVVEADGKLGERELPVLGNTSGVSQTAFDALNLKVNSLDAILATKASKEEVARLSQDLAALTVKVNSLPTTGSTPSPQLTQILTELQSIINRLNDIAN